jgi:inositol transport system ATP-binding protein
MKQNISEKKTILTLTNVSKQFPGVRALDNVSFRLNEGEVHVLMGENGAGKSTLMNILAGIYQADTGIVTLNSEQIEIKSPKDALQAGISMIHQELNPIPHMTVAENIYVGREPTLFSFGLVNKKEMISNTEELFQHLGIEIDPSLEMAELNVAETQMVEIARAISYNSKIIIMDEPTSAITDTEVQKLFEMIRKLKEKNVAIIYISHKMNEIFTIGDRVTVLRDGQFVGTHKVEDINKQQLITMMVGREVTNIFPKNNTNIGDFIFSVENLSLEGLFENVSFQVRRGEIFGIAGLMGAGRTEVVETIFGIRKKKGGIIKLNGVDLEIRNPKDAIKKGIAIVSEDRKLMGLNLKASVKDNITIVTLRQYCSAGIVRKRNEACVVDEKIDQLRIKTPSRNQKMAYLSGGNQQKAVVAKWLLSVPDVLIMDEPTRGIDVGAKAEIHGLISELANRGMAIIMISSELPEIIGMSDRVMVMHEGRVTGFLERDELEQEKIMHLATGHVEGQAV